MLELIRTYKRNRAVRRYIHSLGPALKKRYGALDQYTVLQIQKTVQHLRLDSSHLPYAVALYRHEPSPNSRSVLGIDRTSLARLRAEVADNFLDGNDQYRARHVLALSKTAQWKGGPSPNWWSNNLGKTSL